MRLIDSFIVLAVASSTAFAANCTPGLNYCGSTLMYIEKGYREQISQHLHNRKEFVGVQDYPYDNMLFECIGGSSGIINLIKQCDMEGFTLPHQSNQNPASSKFQVGSRLSPGLVQIQSYKYAQNAGLNLESAQTIRWSLQGVQVDSGVTEWDRLEVCGKMSEGHGKRSDGLGFSLCAVPFAIYLGVLDLSSDRET
ncbi:hypothetical protein BDQ12DRAFT_728168 [Crucibulum laeve]|uniref:Uncharacterized protein n=1 Tax=Crucibulum laeve TaxID=68775 RepID=A0A5C3LJU5_9AGAR|nr:hypothetical protein BDQ12DRAFT_728168 [Crucibulum laeve]